MWGYWSLDSLLNFSTSFLLEEGLLMSTKKYCTSPFTTWMSFISEHDNLPMNTQKSIWPESSCSLLEQYLHTVLISKCTSLDVGLISWRSLFLLFTIDYDNTQWASLRSFEWNWFPGVLNASTKLLTIWELGSELFIIFILKFLLKTVINLYFNNDINNIHLSPSHLESK